MESMSIFDDISGVQGLKVGVRCARSPLWCAGAHKNCEAGVHAPTLANPGVLRFLIINGIIFVRYARKLNLPLLLYDEIEVYSYSVI